MKRLIIIIGLFIQALSLLAQNIDVVLIGGQSNGTGQGYMRNIPREFEINTSVLFYYSKYLNQGRGADTWQPLCQASETEDKFGVELSLGTYLQKVNPDIKFALIKHGLSGSNLYEQWNPGNRAGEKQGEEYLKFIQTVHAGLKSLKDKGYTPVIRAMVWQQGEGDARDIAGMDNSRAYGENLRNLILQIRKEFSCEDMLFVYGYVIPMEAPRFTGRKEVRENQKLVAESSNSPLSVKNAFLVEADDLQMRRSDYKSPMPEDDVHLGTYGILNLGERFAKEIIKQVYKDAEVVDNQKGNKSFGDRWRFVGKAVEEPGYHIWGSSPIVGKDGKIHLFCSRWKTEAKFDPGWRSHSEIAHYVSDSPEGPFRFKEVVLSGTGKDTWDKYGIHNPAIHKVDDKYVLLYIGNDNYNQPPHPSNQRIGMLIADDVNGPWKKVGKNGCILSPSDNPLHWTYQAKNGVNNPALLQHPKGGFLLYFKSQDGKMGVAFADKVEGPYIMYPTPVTKNNRAIEDGYAFIYNGEICLLTTDNHGIIKKGGGILWRSTDGVNFDKYEVGFHLFEDYVGKEALKNSRQIYNSFPKFERPQILMMNNRPAYLYVPSGANMDGKEGTVSYVLKFK